MPSRVRDMGGEAVDPLERVECDGGRAGSWIGRGIHNQVAVIEFLQGIHGHCRAGDIAGLGLQRGDFGGIDRRSGID